MGEMTRDELAARLDALKARVDARAQATDSKIDALRWELKMEMSALAHSTDSKINALRYQIEDLQVRIEGRTRATDSNIESFGNSIDAAFRKGRIRLLKWMMGTTIAMTAIGAMLIILMLSNVTPR